MRPKRVIIMGAAGRDFHCFNTLFRENPDYRVVAFTATQIPRIDDRSYPPELAGRLYPEGIPIRPLEQLEELVRRHAVDVCYFCYSDVSYVEVMQVGARVLAAGAGFAFLPPQASMLKSSRPVVSVVAVRTGSGKSQTTRYIAGILKRLGRRTAVIRHPMPYGSLLKQRVQKFETLADLRDQNCTIEEMEEYEPHLNEGNVVFAGVDYSEILRAAEEAAEVILWDGGNNDATFLQSDLMITVADPYRAGNELLYYPSEFNLRMADVVVINKVATAHPEQVEKLQASVRKHNPQAAVILCNSPVSTATPEAITGRRVLLVEDGPTVTHGEMNIGAAYIAAQEYGAKEIVDPRPYARGSIAEAYRKFPHLTQVLPALGYFPEQLRELEETIAAVDCDSVVVGTPIDLTRVVKIPQAAVRVTYRLEEREPGRLEAALRQHLGL